MRIFKYFLVIFCLVSLSSCLPSVELSQRAIVEAIGIDKIDGEFVVSIAYYAPSYNNEQSTETEFVKETAKDISSAISEISLKINKELYLGHNNFIVIGSKAAENDILYILEHFDAEPQTKADICVFVAETAEKITNNEEKAKLSYLSVLEIIEKSAKVTDDFEYKLFKVLDRNNSNGTFALAFGALKDDFYFNIVGSSLFIDGFMVS